MCIKKKVFICACTHVCVDDSVTCTWLMYTCAVEDSCTCEWRIYTQHALCLDKWMGHVTQMNESCHTYEWVMPHIWMSHVTHMNESCHTYEWVMSHIWMGHATHMNGSCHTYEWVTSHIWIWRSLSHIWMSHVTHHVTQLNESCLTYQRTKSCR